ncbi:MAG: hypothetical protein K1X44_02235 [Alphaproteobacteria bacterium]|nr:hypothetical protein [Alphaproteobacteria bacterium]
MPVLPHQKAWFKVKNYGLGAYPISWQGWLCLFIHICLFTILLVWFLNLQDLNFIPIGIAILIMVVLMTSIIWIAWKKSDQNWQWRWGQKK